jgi:hypothetical protein
VVVSDELVVGDVTIAGEDPLAREVGAALERGTPAEVLPGRGVRWVLVYRDDPEADRLDLTGLRRVYADRDLALYRVPGPVTPAAEPGSGARVAVLAAHGVAGGLVLAAAVTVGVAGWARRREVRHIRRRGDTVR